MSFSHRITVAGGERLTGELLALALRRHGLFESSWHEDDDIPAQLGEEVLAVLLDPEAPLLRSAREHGARAVAIVTTSPVTLEQEVGLVLSGADAVLPSETGTDEVIRHLEVVDRGGAVLTPEPLRALLDRVRAGVTRVASVEDLTTREQQILQSIDRGESVKQTARVLGISPKTVENLQSRLFSKLAVRNRAQAVSHAHGLGLLAGGRAVAVLDLDTDG